MDETENIMLSEPSDRERHTVQHHLYVGDKKNKNKEKKNESWIQRTGWWFPKAGIGG